MSKFLDPVTQAFIETLFSPVVDEQFTVYVCITADNYCEFGPYPRDTAYKVANDFTNFDHIDIVANSTGEVVKTINGTAEIKMKYDVGEVVRIINLEKIYTSYIGFMEKYAKQYLSQWTDCKLPMLDEVGTIIARGEHELFHCPLYVVQVPSGTYIVSEEGIDSYVTTSVCQNKIVITTDGTTTTAVLYDGNDMLCSASSICPSCAAFNFITEANIAYERLMSDDPENNVACNYYSGKVICISVDADENNLTVGKLYTITEGKLTWDDGDVTDTFATSLEELNDRFHPWSHITFIESKE